jgi:glycosyltransferase involved in cell wall biosynthesis
MITKELPEVPVHVLFHPVLPTLKKRASWPNSALRIGSFGIPDEAKRTGDIIEAFAIVRKSHPNATLVIAGYQARRYGELKGLRSEDGIEVVDSPTDDSFDDLIESVDVAVQLRLMNVGESSGPISRLIEAGKPTIVSDIGSFPEFGDAVRILEKASEPAALAEAIIEEAHPTSSRLQAINAYRMQHTPRVFCDLLADIIPPVPASPRPLS